MLSEAFDETLAGAGVGVAAIHEAVEEHIFEAVVVGDVDQGCDVLKR